MGSQNATGILFTTLFATACSTCVAIIVAKTLQRLPKYRINPNDVTHQQDHEPNEPRDIDLPDEAELGPSEVPPTPFKYRLLQWAFLSTLFVAALIHVGQEWMNTVAMHGLDAMTGGQSILGFVAAPGTTLFTLSKDILSYWLLPALMAAILLYGLSKGVKVYEALVSGAREGFDVAKRIIPYLVAILVAVAMFRASGALGLLIGAISPLTQAIGMPAEALPMALMRPLSGSGAYGILAETMRANGPDSLVGYMVSTFQGSTETTFYVIAVYFGAVQVKRVRHTLATCLIADLVGIIAAVWICVAMYG
jgi:spore maturation protein SpmB